MKQAAGIIRLFLYRKTFLPAIPLQMALPFIQQI